MALTGRRALRLLNCVIDLVAPHLPDSVRVEAMPGDRGSVVLKHFSDRDRRMGDHVIIAEDHESSDHGRLVVGDAGLILFGVGTWVPLLPRKIRARLEAQHATESVLAVAYAQVGEPNSKIDFHVRAADRNGAVIVTYRSPAPPRTKIELPPLPLDLF